MEVKTIPVPALKWGQLNFFQSIVSYLLMSFSVICSVQYERVPASSLSSFITINKTMDSYTYESYQSGIRCTASFPPLEPQTLKDIQDIIFFSLQNHYHVKAVGSLHSITDVICTDGLVVKMNKVRHFSYDPVTTHATVGAGMTVKEMTEVLHQKGRGVSTTPGYGGISVGGAVGTGAHGSALERPATFSDQIVSLTYVDGQGNIRKVMQGEEDFKAFRVHLGLLGIVYEVVIRTVPQYKLQITHFPQNDEILWERSNGIMDVATNNDMFQFWWFPLNKQVVMSFGNEAPANASGNCQFNLVPECVQGTCRAAYLALELMQATREDVSFFFVQSLTKIGLVSEVPVYRIPPVFTKADGITPCLPSPIGYSHRMIASGCKECPWFYGAKLEDSSISIDLSELPAALRTIREIFNLQLASLPYNGIFFRFLAGSDSYLGMNRGDKDTVDIESVTVARADRNQPRLGVAAFQAIGLALIERHGGRPHWGKNGLYFSNKHVLSKSYPLLPKFIEVMKRMDPYEIFMNDFGSRLKYGTTQATVPPEKARRCALNEVCVCSKDSDCGGGGPLDHICGTLVGEKVCIKRPNPVSDTKDIVSRSVIGLANELANGVDYLLGALQHFQGFGGGGFKKSEVEEMQLEQI